MNGSIRCFATSSSNLAPTRSDKRKQEEDEFEATFLLHFGGLTIPFEQKPDNIEVGWEYVK